jgi:hypothetical protein
MGEINLISHLKNRLKKLKPLRTTTRRGDEGGGEGQLGRNHQILRRRAEEEERSAGFGSSPPHARTRHHLTSEQYWRVSLGLGRESLRRERSRSPQRTSYYRGGCDVTGGPVEAWGSIPIRSLPTTT